MHHRFGIRIIDNLYFKHCSKASKSHNHVSTLNTSNSNDRNNASTCLHAVAYVVHAIVYVAHTIARPLLAIVVILHVVVFALHAIVTFLHLLEYITLDIIQTRFKIVVIMECLEAIINLLA
mgnify:CR=1 FL=1